MFHTYYFKIILSTLVRGFTGEQNFYIIIEMDLLKNNFVQNHLSFTFDINRYIQLTTCLDSVVCEASMVLFTILITYNCIVHKLLDVTRVLKKLPT